VQPSSAPRGKLVVAHPERKAQRALQRLVGASLCPVEVVADLAALSAAVDEQTIAVVDAALARTRRVRGSRSRVKASRPPMPRPSTCC
jgi:hypothetical protein